MKRVLLALGGVAWFLIVFFATWWLTFPSQAIADRLVVQVSQATDGEYQLALSDVRPWWTGVSASNVIVSRVDRGRGAEAAVATPLFAFEGAWVRAGLLSLLRRQPRVAGGVAIGSGELEFDVVTGRNKRGTELTTRSVELTAADFPLQDLLGMAGASIEATGGIDLAVSLAAEDGMRDATGELRIEGDNLVITKLDPELTGGMDLGMEVPLDRIDVKFDVEQGKATVKGGRVESALVDATIDGDVTLREDLQRSTLNVGFALRLGDELSMFESFLKRAQWADGSFHYRCAGTVARPNCREESERGSRAPRSAASGGGDEDGEDRSTASRRTRGTEPATPRPSSLSPEEREKRREEALERLRANRERRAAGEDEPQVGNIAPAEELPEIDDEPPPDEGEPVEDVVEELIPEELPPEEPVLEE